MTKRCCRSVGLSLMIILGTPSLAQEDAAQAQRREHLANLVRKEEVDLAKEYVKLATWCWGRSLADEGRTLLAAARALVPDDPKAEELENEGPREGQATDRNRRIHDARLQRLRTASVAAFDRLAKVAETQELTDQLQAIRQRILTLDPDHAPTREAMGMARFEERWVAKEDLPFLERGLVLHAGSIWVPADVKAGLDTGTYRFEGKSLTQAQANRARATWDTAWILETRHFVLRTPVSIERAVQVIQELERAYEVFVGAIGLPAFPANTRITYHWFRNQQQFREIVPESDPQGQMYFGKLTVNTFDYADGPLIELIPERLIGSWSTFHPTYRNAPNMAEDGAIWIYFGCGKLGTYIARSPDGSFDVRWKELIEQLGPYVRKARDQHGANLIPSLAGSTLQFFAQHYEELLPTAVLLCAVIYQDPTLRERLGALLHKVLLGQGTPNLPDELLGRPIESFADAINERIGKGIRGARRDLRCASGRLETGLTCIRVIIANAPFAPA